MSKKCLGCGVKLQSDNEEYLGYTKSLDMDYCMRCFRITHYHDLSFNENHIKGDEIIKSLYGKKGYAFFFVDYLNLSRESITYFKQIDMPKCLVISKCDTIPKSIYLPRITEWLKKEYDVEETILFIQKNSKSSIKKVLDIMEKNIYKNYYMVGMTNAGKSTFLNELLSYTDNLKSNLTVSEKPNTTLDFVRIPFNYGTIFDTAGIPYSYYESDNEFLQLANIKKEIKPITYPLKENMSLILEDKIRIEVDTSNSITYFGSENINITKVYDKNTRLKDLACVELKLKNNMNVLIKGVCFFYVKNACTFKIYGVDSEMLETSISYMGGKNE